MLQPSHACCKLCQSPPPSLDHANKSGEQYELQGSSLRNLLHPTPVFSPKPVYVHILTYSSAASVRSLSSHQNPSTYPQRFTILATDSVVKQHDPGPRVSAVTTRTARNIRIQIQLAPPSEQTVSERRPVGYCSSNAQDLLE